MVEDYLNGENVSNIARRLYRSAGFVKSTLQRVGVPERPSSAEARTRAVPVPEGCQSDTFDIGETAWSVVYHAPCRIIKEVESSDRYLGKVYRIYVMERVNSEGSFFPHILAGGFYAHTPAYDIARIRHLEKYGVNLETI
jgi:hypothetical protein